MEEILKPTDDPCCLILVAAMNKGAVEITILYSDIVKLHGSCAKMGSATCMIDIVDQN